MKTFIKSLALVLALLMAFGISASAAEPTPQERSALPEIKLGQVTTGSLDSKNLERWYRFEMDEAGDYRFTVDGAYYCLYAATVYNGHDLLVAQDAFFNSDGVYPHLSTESGTFYVRIFLYDYWFNEHDEQRDFTISVEFTSRSSESPWQIKFGGIYNEIKASIKNQFSDASLVDILGGIGMLPLFGIMLGLFFAPFSVGGTLIISLISALFLPLTLLFSPFILIGSAKNWFSTIIDAFANK